MLLVIWQGTNRVLHATCCVFAIANRLNGLQHCSWAHGDTQLVPAVSAVSAHVNQNTCSTGAAAMPKCLSLSVSLFALAQPPYPGMPFRLPLSQLCQQ